MSDKFEVTVEEEEGGEHSVRSVLKVIRNGEVVVEEEDSGESEDNSFTRDWHWVSSAIEQAYKYGVEDGANSLESKSKQTLHKGIRLTKTGQTKLAQACLDDDTEEVKRLLAENSLCVIQECWNDDLAFHVAAKFSSLDIVMLILLATPKEYRNHLNQYLQSPYDYALLRGEHCENIAKIRKDDWSPKRVLKLLSSKEVVLKLFDSYGMVSMDDERD